MSSSVTVVTAAHPPGYQWLREAGESLLEQRSEIHWVIAADDANSRGVEKALEGLSEKLLERTTIVPTLRAGCGAAVARNLALSYVNTEWMAVLDSDDQWLPGGIDILLESCLANDVLWAAGDTDCLEDGARRPWLPLGEWANRRVSIDDVSGHHNEQLPWHPPVLVANTAVVRRTGGWPAFPAAEDTALIFALLATSPGYVVDKTVFLYRRWPEQTTQILAAEFEHDAFVMGWHGRGLDRALAMRAAS